MDAVKKIKKIESWEIRTPASFDTREFMFGCVTPKPGALDRSAKLPFFPKKVRHQ